MMLLLADYTQVWVNTALGAGALLGGVGYALGQFVSSRRKGLGDSLKTALDEIEVERVARERLARLAVEKADELAATKLENSTLRSALSTQGGKELAGAIIDHLTASTAELKKFIHEEHERCLAELTRMERDK